jgi:periplasmic protein CpxP/Spy
MKKAVILLTAVLFAGVLSTQAQGGGGNFPRRTVEERVKSVMDKLGDLKLDKDQTTKTDSVFTEFYRSRDKMVQDAMAGGGQPDRDKMRESNQKLAADRDDKLKKIFTEDQYKKWKDEIEATTRPQRGGGGGNGGGGNGNN